MTKSLLSTWVSQDQWFQQVGFSKFKSRTRWDWFLRTHREELIDLGVIGLLGRSILVNSASIEAALETVIRDDARRHVGVTTREAQPLRGGDNNVQ